MKEPEPFCSCATVFCPGIAGEPDCGCTFCAADARGATSPQIFSIFSSRGAAVFSAREDSISGESALVRATAGAGSWARRVMRSRAEMCCFSGIAAVRRTRRPTSSAFCPKWDAELRTVGVKNFGRPDLEGRDGTESARS